MATDHNTTEQRTAAPFLVKEPLQCQLSHTRQADLLHRVFMILSAWRYAPTAEHRAGAETDLRDYHEMLLEELPHDGKLPH